MASIALQRGPVIPTLFVRQLRCTFLCDRPVDEKCRIVDAIDPCLFSLTGRSGLGFDRKEVQ
ncbi:MULTISPECIES: hypothetical protein [unclassified Microcoleus]|uniref:hypothetical protein n=1 Tax=unclassified Microcoleus TaxID=2642155 RepID=UPI002FCFABEC